MKKLVAAKENKFQKFLKIINPRTLMGKGIILGTILAIALLSWFITVTAMSINAYINTSADKTSFTDSTGLELTNINKAVRVNNKDFKDFNIYFTCSNYNADGNNSTFKIYYYKSEQELTLSGAIQTKLLLTADYIDYSCYSSSYSISSLATTLSQAQSTSTYYKTYSISKLAQFPAYATTTVWPYTLTKVDSPIAYLYLNYSYKEGSKTITKTYLVRYDYSEFNVLQGGIKA